MRIVRTLRKWTILFCLELMEASRPEVPNVSAIVSTIGKYTGLRYVSDLVMDWLGNHPTWFFGYAETAAWQYTAHQTHRPRCPHCTWMIAPWPFNGTHEYCDTELAQEHNGITGPHSIAVSYCECGSPLTARMIRRKSHVCELHMENLRPRRLHGLRSLIGV
jgi:hypothetical protein